VCVHLQPGPEGTSTVKLRDHPKVKKYFKMVQMSVSDPNAVAKASMRMESEGLNPRVLTMVSAALPDTCIL
jgi:hypothetical protein